MRGVGKAMDGFFRRHAWRFRWLLFWGALIIGGAVAVVTAAYYFDVFTESDAFCGRICHANRPQYVTHQVSNHANVECGVCHIGPGLWPKVEAKILGVKELVETLANSYERPLAPPVERLKSARVICEQCHWPEKVYGDREYRVSKFSTDEGNTATQVLVTLWIDSGPTVGSPGAHWHIENEVWFVSTDPVRQDVPWVGVAGNDGGFVEYLARNSALTVEELQELPRHEMDCLDCHNRAAHQFQNPERKVDEALANGSIDPTLPFVKREAVRLLSAPYLTQEEGIEAMEALEEFYRAEYPQVHLAKEESVRRAVETLQDIYHQTVFPEMKLTWEVYPNNLGHTDFPGCFRCHDGQHLNAQGQAISRSCNTCHSLPSAVTPE